MPTWTCHECGAKGETKTPQQARISFEKHWLAMHQEVSF